MGPQGDAWMLLNALNCHPPKMERTDCSFISVATYPGQSSSSTNWSSISEGTATSWRRGRLQLTGAMARVATEAATSFAQPSSMVAKGDSKVMGTTEAFDLEREAA
eukprot:1968337-Pyramimonas_sp.AAC.1